MLIIDDSTNSETKLISSELTKDPRVKYIKNQKNEGLPFSRNRGLEKASGKWITFLDDDDKYITNSTLEKIVDILKSNTYTWHTFDRVAPNGEKFTKIYKSTKDHKYNWTEDFLYGKKIRGDLVHFMRKSLIAGTHFYGSHRSQWQFWYELAQKGDFIYSPLKTVEAEYLPEGLSSSRNIVQDRMYLRQQFFYMMRSFSTMKYMPLIATRYILSFPLVEKMYRKFK
tara:strand:- start:94 stop:771 length:678 start_codon:yes stop_codon:yes gene_type:complete